MVYRKLRLDFNQIEKLALKIITNIVNSPIELPKVNKYLSNDHYTYKELRYGELVLSYFIEGDI